MDWGDKPPAVQGEIETLPAVVANDPPWLLYDPPRDPATGRVRVDITLERARGLNIADFAVRLRQNGLAELALATYTDLLQDTQVEPAVRARIAKDVLDRAHGAPVTSVVQQSNVQQTINVVIDNLTTKE